MLACLADSTSDHQPRKDTGTPRIDPFRVGLKAGFLARRLIVWLASLPESKRAGFLASRISGFPSFLLTCREDGKTTGKK